MTVTTAIYIQRTMPETTVSDWKKQYTHSDKQTDIRTHANTDELGLDRNRQR